MVGRFIQGRVIAGASGVRLLAAACRGDGFEPTLLYLSPHEPPGPRLAEIEAEAARLGLEICRFPFVHRGEVWVGNDQVEIA